MCVALYVACAYVDNPVNVSTFLANSQSPSAMVFDASYRYLYFADGDTVLKYDTSDGMLETNSISYTRIFMM